MCCTALICLIQWLSQKLICGQTHLSPPVHRVFLQHQMPPMSFGLLLSVLSLASVVHHASWYCNWNIPHLPTVCVSIMFLSTYKHILLALLVIHKHLKLKVFNHCRHTSGWDRWPLKLLGLLISEGQFEVTEMSNWRFICVVDSFLFVGVFVFFFFTHVYP